MKYKLTEKNPNTIWVNLTPVDYIRNPLNIKMFEATDVITDQEKYNSYFEWKFEQSYKHCKDYSFYKRLLYKPFYGYNNLITYLKRLDNFIEDNIIQQSDNIVSSASIKFSNNEHSNYIRNLCVEFGFEVTTSNINSYICYSLNLNIVPADISNDVYSTFGGICYYIGNKDELNNIQKFGLYQTPANKTKCIERKPIRFFLDYQNALKILKDNEIIIKINLNNNKYKPILFKDLKCPEYDVFTFELICPDAISEIIE